MGRRGADIQADWGMSGKASITRADVRLCHVIATLWIDWAESKKLACARSRVHKGDHRQGVGDSKCLDAHDDPGAPCRVNFRKMRIWGRMPMLGSPPPFENGHTYVLAGTEMGHDKTASTRA